MATAIVLGTLALLTLLTATPIEARPAARWHPPTYPLTSWYQDTAKACPGYYGIHAWGVAHRTLPCGTRLRLSYHGRTTWTRVIDRGPYIYGRSLDLHAPVARALGFSGVGRVKMEVRR